MSRRVRPVEPRLLSVVGFTDHAIERFAERAGLDVADRRRVEPIARDLLLQEGSSSYDPPRWYRSSNAADGYLEAGEWMLFVLRTSRRRPGAWDVVTVLSNGDGTTWPVARRRGLILTPPPLPPRPRRRRVRVSWLGSVWAGLRARRRAPAAVAPGSRVSADAAPGRWASIRTAHAARRAPAAAREASSRRP
ncbi:hypothetical protein Q5424_12590, partial [Conexibacter sp. JD483]|uniref:hypothetical protein n=1 Tax=Conexibacter sp. JD483 TaxID=3064471 RepID=UPI002870119E